MSVGWLVIGRLVGRVVGMQVKISWKGGSYTSIPLSEHLFFYAFVLRKQAITLIFLKILIHRDLSQLKMLIFGEIFIYSIFLLLSWIRREKGEESAAEEYINLQYDNKFGNNRPAT